MKTCLIGQNLTNLILAALFAEKKVTTDIFVNSKFKNFKTDRTIALSPENFDYLKKLANKLLPSWKSNEIKIFIEDLKSKEIINFKSKNKESFNLLIYSKLYNIFLNKIKKSKYINFVKNNNSSLEILKKIEPYDLVINSENRNIISKKYFTNKLKKNYDGYAYTFVVSHSKFTNDVARQIFTKYGPLAFLPISSSKTSIVYSYSGKIKKDNEIIDLFNKYNSFYKISKIGQIEKFELHFLMLRNYTHKNILAFGDLIHRIHPLAGQGFNMTIRDIKIISDIIDKKVNLGLPIDKSVAIEFQNSSKHINYLYGRAIDGIYEFFKIDNKLNNTISKPLFGILNKNKIFKKYSTIFSDLGII